MHVQWDVGRGPVRSLRGASDTGAAGLPLNRSLDSADRQAYMAMSIHKPDEPALLRTDISTKRLGGFYQMDINRPNGCLFLSSTETMDCGFTWKPAVVECCLYRIKVCVLSSDQ